MSPSTDHPGEAECNHYWIVKGDLWTCEWCGSSFQEEPYASGKRSAPPPPAVAPDVEALVEEARDQKAVSVASWLLLKGQPEMAACIGKLVLSRNRLAAALRRRAVSVETDLRVRGIGRDAENERVLVLYFDRRPTDDEMCRGWAPSAIMENGVMQSGVAALAQTPDHRQGAERLDGERG